MPEEAFDVAIVGGGINGCGTFRDLCAQGVHCLLIERDDFCAGASQASSRLMHGGLKYLETGQFRLVRESATERNMLLATAPHVVKLLPCLVPVRSWAGGIAGSAGRFLRLRTKLADRGFLVTALGLALYDAYGRRFRAMPRHRMLGTSGAAPRDAGARRAHRRRRPLLRGPDQPRRAAGAGVAARRRGAVRRQPGAQSRRAAAARGRRPRLSDARREAARAREGGGETRGVPGSTASTAGSGSSPR